MFYTFNTRCILNLATNMQIKEVYAMQSGGVFYVKEAKSVTLNGNTIHYFYANITGSIMHSISAGVIITL